jgi:hypothetical protein
LQVGAGHAQQLVADAGRALEVQATTVEETPDTIYLVLPSVSTASAGGEIPDQELEAVAGGEGTNWTCGGWTCAGPSSTCETQYNTCGTDCTG